MKNKLLLFDFDGTVIDNSEGIYNCINNALNIMGIEKLPEKTLRRFVGPSLFDSFCRYCENDSERSELFVRLYRERYAPIGSLEVKLYPGITELLKALSADGYILAVCSGKPYDFVIKIAKHLGIFDLFSAYFCPGFASHSSDKSRLIDEAAEHFSAEKEDILMIGDTLFDIAAAKKAGVKSLGVLYGFSEPGELESAGADFIAADVPEIYEIITGKEL